MQLVRLMQSQTQKSHSKHFQFSIRYTFSKRPRQSNGVFVKTIVFYDRQLHVDQPLKKLLNPSINQSINRSINQPFKQQIKVSPINPSISLRALEVSHFFRRRATPAGIVWRYRRATPAATSGWPGQQIQKLKSFQNVRQQ